MSRQSEQILEEQLIVQLQKMGYQYIVINDEHELLANLKSQLEKHNNISFTATEFEKVINL
jgi:type I restriction enzyme R subunit